MDITRNVASERGRNLLSGDYDSYHAHTSHKIHTLRKRLGITTPKGRKYTPKAPVTADDVAKSSEYEGGYSRRSDRDLTIRQMDSTPPDQL
jgi:signal recognition particle subunit SRP68